MRGKEVSLQITDSSRDPLGSAPIAIPRWTKIDWCRGVIHPKGRNYKILPLVLKSITKTGSTSRIWIQRETITWQICLGARTSWSKTQRPQPWIRKCLAIRTNRSKWRRRIIRCCIRILAILQSWVVAKLKLIWFQGGKKWLDQVVWINPLELPPI